MQLKHPLREAGKKVIMKQRTVIRHRAQKLKAKAIAEKQVIVKKILQI